MRINDHKMKFLLFTAVLVIGSCQVPYENENAQVVAPNKSSEELLAAQGSWNMVEEKRPANPLNEHLKARSQVDSHDRSAKRSYTKEASEDALNEEVHFRVIKLEHEVADLRSDFKKLLPPLSRLITSDRELSIAIDEIQKEDIQRDKPKTAPKARADHDMAEKPKDVVAKYAQPKSESVKQAEKPKMVKPVLQGGPNAVVAVRRGEHPGKTRLVMDIKQKAQVKYDLDNNEKVLLVEMPGVGWDAKTESVFKDHPLIKSYAAQGSSSAGTTVAIELKKPAKVLLSTVLGPNSTNPNHRYVLDIAPL